MPTTTIIESSQRSSGTSTNFTYQLDKSLVDIARYSVELVTIDTTIYNITSGNNIIFFNDGSNRQATIPPGLYNGFDLATAVGTTMNNVNAGYSASYSVNTFALTITHTSLDFTLQFASLGGPYKQLGFNQVDTTSTSHTVTGPNACQLNNPRILNIQITGMGEEVRTANLTNNKKLYTTFLMPIKNGLGGIETYQPETKDRPISPSSSINTFTVVLTDVDNKAIDLRANDWTVVVKTWSRRELEEDLSLTSEDIVRVKRAKYC